MDRTEALVVVIAGLLLVLSALFVLPFLDFFLLAVLLAFALRPLQRRLEDRTSPGIAAALLVASAAVALVLPLVLVLRRVITEARTLLEQLREGQIQLDQLEASILELTGFEVDLSEILSSAAQELGSGSLEGAIGILGRVSHLLIGVGLTLFLLYYFLKNGDSFLRWTSRTMPLPDHILDELYAEINGIMQAVLIGHVFVAIVQGFIAGLGLVAVGVPNAVFWTIVMIVLAVLPIIGSFLVWGPAAVYLLAIGRVPEGVFLFVYGTIVVGLSDDYLRPIVVDRYAELNPAVIVIGILGGIYVMGFMGIFFGPIVIGSLRATLDIYRREYVEGPGTRSGEGA